MIFKNKLLPALAAVGLLVAIGVAVGSEKKAPTAEPVAESPRTPFKSCIGGAGIVEASSENIGIGTSLPGIVKTVEVKVGDRVKVGQPLFAIDDRELQSEARVKGANLLKAKAAVQEALASLKDYESQYALVRGVEDGKAVSIDDVQKRRDAVALGKAKVESAKASVSYAEADLNSTKTAIDRLIVRSPIAGEVLQVNIRPGEYAATGNLSTPLMKLGNIDRMHIRVDIDENDAWRFKPGARAAAFLRGNSQIQSEIGFVRVEPYVTAKTSLTGSSTERVDTRVLQVIYSFDREKMPAYVGQQLDVFIEAPEFPIQAKSGVVK